MIDPEAAEQAYASELYIEESNFTREDGDIATLSDEEFITRARGYLKQRVPRAIERLGYLVDNAEDDKTRLAASTDLLDRTGITKKQTVEIQQSPIGADVLVSAFAQMSKLFGGQGSPETSGLEESGSSIGSPERFAGASRLLSAPEIDAAPELPVLPKADNQRLEARSTSEPHDPHISAPSRISVAAHKRKKNG